MDEAAKLSLDLGILNAGFGQESSVAIDAHHLSADQVRDLIQKVVAQATSGQVQLATVNVGADVLSKLGGPNGFFDNARNDGGTIIGGTADGGKVVFSFKP